MWPLRLQKKGKPLLSAMDIKTDSTDSNSTAQHNAADFGSTITDTELIQSLMMCNNHKLIITLCLQMQQRQKTEMKCRYQRLLIPLWPQCDYMDKH